MGSESSQDTQLHEMACFFDKQAVEKQWEGLGEEERRWIAAFLERFPIRPDWRIFEPGCGTGRLSAFLSEKVDNAGAVAACDISEAMIGKANKRRLPGNIQFFRGAAEKLCRELGPFDLIICYQCFPHFLDLEGAVTPLAQSLGPGGALWILHPSGREKVNTIHRNGPEVIQDHLLPPIEELKTLLGQGGFIVDDGSDTAEGYWCVARKKGNYHADL